MATLADGAVTVRTHAPLTALGMRTALREAGLRVEEPDDLHAWACQAGRRVVLLPGSTPEQRTLIAELRAECPALGLVAIIQEWDHGFLEDALRAGATTAIREDHTEEQLCLVVRAALREQALLDGRIVRDLVPTAPARPRPLVTLTDEQTSWLAQLCDGATVQDIATGSHYSRDHMARKLKQIYRLLGALNDRRLSHGRSSGTSSIFDLSTRTPYQHRRANKALRGSLPDNLQRPTAQGERHATAPAAHLPKRRA